MSKLIKEMLDALNAVNQNKTEPYDRKGEVKRIEGKIAWVKLEGSDRETPIQMTIACDVGDTVQARIGGGSAWLTGNLTAPPTDDKKANQAISMVTNVVQEIQETVGEALEDVSSVEDVTVQYCLSDSSSTFTQYGDWSNTPPTYVSGKYYWTRTVLYDEDGNPTYGTPQYSQDTQLSVETDVAFKSNNNHFWHDTSGAYVTTADKSYTSGYATRITSSGILQSYNNYLLSGWTNSGIAFYAGDGTTASNSTTLASFGSGGANLYDGSGSYSLGVASDGVNFNYGGSNVARISYGSYGAQFYAGTSTLYAYSSVQSGRARSAAVSNSGYTAFVMCEASSTNSHVTWMSNTTTMDSDGDLDIAGTLTADGLEHSVFDVTSTTITYTSSGNIRATATETKTGYWPIGVVGHTISTGGIYSRGAHLSSRSMSQCEITLRMYNPNSSTDITAYVYVLWVKQ